MKTMKPKRITILLPGSGRFPVGGYKVAYEYANRLAQRGHHVSVVHPAFVTKGAGFVELARSFARYFLTLTRGYRPDSWFAVDPSVRLTWVPSLAQRNIPDGDAIIATAWQTSEWAVTYSPSKGKKFYLIQQVETWHGMEERVIATWCTPMRKLVIARWLMDFAQSLGEEASYQPNGLDFKKFFMDNSPETRDVDSVMMLYHVAMDKGSADGLKALSIVQHEVPSLRVTLFGTPAAPPDLPVWIRYHHLPSQDVLRKLYNSNAIFVTPSWTEGWALPPAEAMACGAALVATDIGGHRDYAIPEQTALVSPPKDPEALAANILRLIQDQPLRIKMAREGHRFIQQFTWEKSVDQLEQALFRSENES
jgi:glycosyltransferase involved in cell wall biosynthesis